MESHGSVCQVSKMMKTSIGWILLLLGPVFAIVAIINSGNYPKSTIDMIHQVEVASDNGRTLTTESAETMMYALEALAVHLVEDRNAGYIIITVSMGIGCLILLTRRS